MATADIAVPGARDVEEVLRARDLSPFHRKAVLVTGIAWTFVAMEILLVGFVAPIFATTWNLSGAMQGLVNSAALAGSLCGSLVLGRTADRIGRRAIFQYSILWYALFTAVTALAWGPWSVMTLPLPGRARPRWDARRRPVDPGGVPAAAAEGAAARVPRLLVAGRPALRDRPLVPLPRPELRPLRRLELALPVPRGRVSGIARVRRPAHAAREPVLPRPPRAQPGGRGGARGDHGRARRAGRAHRTRGARVLRRGSSSSRRCAAERSRPR